MLGTIISILFGVICANAQQMGMGFNPDPRFVEQMTALKHGDACSYESEEARLKIASKLRSTEDMRAAYTAHKEWQDHVINENLLFCSAAKLLICDKGSEKCVCGDTGNMAVSPSTYKQSNYAIEKMNNQTMCKMAANAYCAPVDMYQSQESQCVMGTGCTSTLDGSLCTYRSLGAFLHTNQRKSKQEIVDDTFMGKICSCQPMSASGPGGGMMMPDMPQQQQMPQMANFQMYNQQGQRNQNQQGIIMQPTGSGNGLTATARPYAKLVVQKRHAPSTLETTGEMFQAFNTLH